MKAKMKPHKLLSMLLALVMVVGLLPMGQVAYAEGTTIDKVYLTYDASKVNLNTAYTEGEVESQVLSNISSATTGVSVDKLNSGLRYLDDYSVICGIGDGTRQIKEGRTYIVRYNLEVASGYDWADKSDSPAIKFYLNGTETTPYAIDYNSSWNSYKVSFTLGTPSTEPHTHTFDQETIKGAALKTAADCTHDAVYYKSCSCGAISTNDADTFTATDSALGHDLVKTVTKATVSKDGKIVKTCTVCGKTVSTTVIPKISSIKLSATSYVYNGKVKTPSVIVKDRTGKTLVKNTDYTVSYASGRKYVGKYAVKVTFKGKYSGTKTLYFNVNPKGTSIVTLSARSKGFYVKWNRQDTQTTGYQIQYSTNSKFTSPKTCTITKNGITSKTISKLSGNKRYYVRVRTYKTVKINGKSTKIYSDWSKVRYVTTKK